MPVQKGAPAPAKLFVTRDQAPAAPPPPQMVIAAPPAPSGFTIKDITELLRAIPPQAWSVILAPRAAPQAAQAPATAAPGLPQGAIMVTSPDAPPRPAQAAPAAPAAPAPPPGPTASQAELIARIGRLTDDERKQLVTMLLDLVPVEALLSRVPDLVSDEHAAMANAYMAANLPHTNAPKEG